MSFTQTASPTLFEYFNHIGWVCIHVYLCIIKLYLQNYRYNLLIRKKKSKWAFEKKNIICALMMMDIFTSGKISPSVAYINL